MAPAKACGDDAIMSELPYTPGAPPRNLPRTPRNARALAAAGLVVAALSPLACSRDWDAYDPRLGGGGTTSTSAGGTTGGTGGTTGGTGGDGATSSGGTGGTTGGTGGTGGTTAGGTMSTGGTAGSGAGGAGGGITCTPAVAMPCYSGPPGTEGKGACKGGSAICEPGGMSYGACLGEVTPVAEDCAVAADDDCNGVANDHCGLWAKQFGAGDDQRAYAVAVDAQGNIAVAGYMGGTANFGGGVLTSAGGWDAFVVKLDKDGKHLWSKVFGDPLDQEALGVAFDAAGNVIVTGYFEGTIGFNGLMPPSYTAVAFQDAFVVKLDPNGATLWSRAFGGDGSEYAVGVAADDSANVLVTGSYDGTIDFQLGLSPPAEDMLDGFVVKLSPGGVPLWEKSFGGVGDDEGLAVTTGPMGHAFVTGYFDETVDFGGGVVTDGGGSDVFLAELDASGDQVFAKAYGGSGTQYARSVSRDATGNLVLAGDFYTSATFGGVTALSAGSSDMFVFKVGPAGAPLWARTFGDPQSQENTAATFDAAGDVAFMGSLEGTVDFGGDPLICSVAGNSDVVVVKLSGATGDHLWSRRFGDGSDQDGRAIAVDGAKNILVVGEFSGTMDFGTGVLDNVSSDDVFVAKLPP